MSRRRRQREEVWQAKHYQPEPDMEWPEIPPEQNFGDDDGRVVSDGHRIGKTHWSQIEVTTDQVSGNRKGMGQKRAFQR